MAQQSTVQSKWQGFWNRGGWWKAVLAAFVYILLYQGFSLLIGTLFKDSLVGKDLFHDPLTLFLSMTLPVMVGSGILFIFAKSVGWLPRPLFGRQPVTGKWWMWIAVALVGVTILLRVLGIDYSSYGANIVLTFLFTGIFIGLSEEILTRGIAVTLLRKKGYSEWVVMVLSSLLFGLLHTQNLILGQDVLTVVATVGFTFGFGVMMYLAMRVTGTIIAPIILHALTDPTTFLASGGVDAINTTHQSPFLAIAGLSTIAFLVFALIAIIFVRGKTDQAAAVSSTPADK